MMQGTLIGFDFGSRRIGVAVGETTTRIASPLGAIEGEANESRFEAIGRIQAAGLNFGPTQSSATNPSGAGSQRPSRRIRFFAAAGGTSSR